MKKLFTLLLLFAAIMVNAATISVSEKSISANGSVNINYSQAPDDSYVYAFKDAALLPVSQTLHITESGNGSFTISGLEPGKYCIKLLTAAQTLDSVFLQVKEYDMQPAPVLMLMTDIHVMNPNLLINDGTAFQKTLDGDRKMLDKSAEIFTALVDTALLYKPQAVLITGDLTKDGEKISHELVASELKRLEAAGINCYVIPGNHDIKNPNAVYYDGDNTTVAADVMPDEFMSIYKDFGYDASISVIDPNSMSYATDLFEGVRLIGIDATRWYDNKSKQHGDDTNVSVGYGKLTESTLKWVLQQADEATKHNKMVVAMMHHQLLQHFNMQEAILPSAAIEQGDSIARVFIEHGIRLILTGHMHIGNISTYYNQQMTDSICEISTGATVSYPSPYRFIGIDALNGTVNVQTRNLYSIKSVADLGVYGREELSKRMPRMITSITNMFSSEINEVKAQLEAQAGQNEILERFFSCVPSDNKVLSDLAYTYMGEAFRLTMLTCSEGNEPYKQTDTVRVMMQNGLQEMLLKMMEAEFNPIERQLMAPLIMSYFLPKMDIMFNSTFGDYSYYETKYINRTDDLYPIIRLTPAKATAIAEQQTTLADEAYYDTLGRRYTERPNVSGVYIHKGEKILIK